MLTAASDYPSYMMNGYVEKIADLEKSCRSKTDRAILEILTSELSYRNSLCVLREYKATVEDDQLRLISDETLGFIFSNLSELVALEEQFFNTMLDIYLRTFPQVDLSPVFLPGKLLDRLYDVYKEYVFNYSKSKYYVVAERGTLKKYAQFLDGLTLESYMIMPVQRVCRYPLLLREVLKGSNPGPKFRECFSQMQHIALRINEALETGSDKMRQEELYKTIEVYLQEELKDIGVCHENDLVYVKIDDQPELLYLCSLYDKIILFMSRQIFTGNKVKKFRQWTYNTHYMTSELIDLKKTEDAKGLTCKLSGHNTSFRFFTEETRDTWYRVLNSLVFRLSQVYRTSELFRGQDINTENLEKIATLFTNLKYEVEPTKATVTSHWFLSFDRKPIYIQKWIPPIPIQAVAIVTSYNHVAFYPTFMNHLTEKGYAVLAFDIRGTGLTAKGGIFTDLLTGKSLSVDSEPQGTTHFQKSREDVKCLIQGARQLFPGVNIAMILGTLPGAVTQPFIWKYCNTKYMPDGILLMPFFVKTLNEFPSLLTTFYLSRLYRHKQIVVASGSSLNSRDQEYCSLAMNSELATRKYCLGTMMSMLTSANLTLKFKRYSVIGETNIPTGLFVPTRDFISDSEKALKIIETFPKRDSLRSWVIERGYHDIISDAARHPFVAEALEWLKIQMNLRKSSLENEP